MNFDGIRSLYLARPPDHGSELATSRFSVNTRNVCMSVLPPRDDENDVADHHGTVRPDRDWTAFAGGAQ